VRKDIISTLLSLIIIILRRKHGNMVWYGRYVFGNELFAV